MRALLLATAVTAAAVVAGPASAHPTFHYEGDCSFTTVSDGTDSPTTRWDGAIYAAVVATEPTTRAPAPVDVHVECILYVNGANPTSVLSASGTALAVGVSDLSFIADSDDVVTMCSAVTVGTDYHVECGNHPGGPPTLPDPIQDLLAQVWDIVDEAE